MTQFLSFVVKCMLASSVGIVRGLVFSCMWNWFVAPYFHLPQMIWADAIGLVLLVTWIVPTGLFYGGKTQKPPDMKTLVEMIASNICSDLLILLMGYIFSRFL